MVNRVVSRDELEDATMTLAYRIAERACFSLKLVKRSLNRMQRQRFGRRAETLPEDQMSAPRPARIVMPSTSISMIRNPSCFACATLCAHGQEQPPAPRHPPTNTEP